MAASRAQPSYGKSPGLGPSRKPAADTATAGLPRVLIVTGIMLAPGPGFGAATLLSSPDHTGTQVPLLITWLAIDRLGDRRYLPWLVAALLTWTEVADQMAIYVGSLPVIVVSATRICSRRGSWRMDARLLAAAAGSVVVAMAATKLIRVAGGFAVAPVTAAVTTPAQIPHHARLALESVLTLFGADFTGAQSRAAAAVAVLHLPGVIAVTWACATAARRLLTAGDRLVPLLFAGIAVNVCAYVERTIRIGDYQVMVWNHDLLPALGGPAAGCHRGWER